MYLERLASMLSGRCRHGAELSFRGAQFTRRDMLKLSAALGVDLGSIILSGCNSRITGSMATPTGSSACSKLSDIHHVVILIQENRSFDHYFGSYRGVRGFSDSSAVFQQPDPSNTTSLPLGRLLPFHLDNSAVNSACTPDIACS